MLSLSLSLSLSSNHQRYHNAVSVLSLLLLPAAALLLLLLLPAAALGNSLSCPPINFPWLLVTLFLR